MAHLAAFVEVHWAPATPDEFWLGYCELQSSGLEVDHLCGVPPCIYVDHLELVTPRENCRRRRSERNNFPIAL